MTPLAMFITKQLTLPIKDRRIEDECGILGKMDDVHCFECTDVLDAADMVLQNAQDGGGEKVRLTIKQLLAESGFLPARKTWIEWRHEEEDHSYRIGFLLTDGGANYAATVYYAFGSLEENIAGAAKGAMTLPLMLGVETATVGFGLTQYEEEQQFKWMMLLVVLLGFINTPRIVGRKQHMPHRGLEQRLARSKGIVGKFPLHAWTEIKLDISAPKDMSDHESVEAHYTGDRALHFCRAHIRIRLGQLEIVRGHWRGDGSLGIKRSRYQLSAANLSAKPLHGSIIKAGLPQSDLPARTALSVGEGR